MLSCGWTHSGSGCQTRRRWWWSWISQSLVFYSSRYLTVFVSLLAALWRWSGVALSHPLLNHSIKAVRGDFLFHVYITFLCHFISHSNHQPACTSQEYSSFILAHIIYPSLAFTILTILTPRMLNKRTVLCSLHH